MAQQLILDLLTPPAPSLENFVPGRNDAVLDALRHCSPGRAIYLWGPQGVGRSHLLQGMSHRNGGHYHAPLAGSAVLLSMATDEEAPPSLVAVDDVHELDADGQAALFALYNRWREVASTRHAFTLLLAGDRAPLNMNVREDLRTRLGWDLVFRLEQLTDEERAHALQTRAAERGLELSADVVAWLLTHHDRDMNRLTALVDALDHYSLARHRAITLPLLKDLLANRQL